MMWEIRNKETESGDEVTDLIWEVELERIVELLLLTMIAGLSPITFAIHLVLRYGLTFLLCSNESLKRKSLLASWPFIFCGNGIETQCIFNFLVLFLS